MLGTKKQQEEKKKEQYIDENGFISFEFSNMKQENKKLLQLGAATPDNTHMIVTPGLNLQGVCRNQTCRVFQKIVWVQKGFGNFDISFEIDNSKCPICHHELEAKTIKSLGYTRANVKCIGKRVGETNKVEWTDKQSAGKFVKFEGYDGQTCQWLYLKFTVTKI